MAQNKVYDLAPAALAALSYQMRTTIGATAPNPYGVNVALLSKLEEASTDIPSHLAEVTDLRAQLNAAIQRRDAATLAGRDAVGETARVVYANSAVTPAMIATLGLQPRSDSRTPIVPVAPTALDAKPLPTGEIALSWKSANRYGVTYRVESRVGSGAWSFVTDLTASRVTLGDYVAGIRTEFRVSASRSGRVSPFSPVAVVWGEAASVAELHLAA